jgi:hypothetical protein
MTMSPKKGKQHVAHREERQHEKDDEEVGRDGLVAKSRLGAEWWFRC